MPSPLVLRAATAAAMVSGLLLAGCVAVPVGPYYGGPYGGNYGGEVVGIEPPPPRYEAYGPPPVIGSVWINGYWNWGGGRYAWTPGRWGPPRPGYRWEPHRWAPYGGGWRLYGGRWARG